MSFNLKKLSITLLLSSLISCGGGEDNAKNPPPGIYFGTLTTIGGYPERASAFISSDNKVAIIDEETWEIFMGRLSNGNVTGTFYTEYGSLPGTSNISKVDGNYIEGSYSTTSLTSSYYTEGVFSLFAAEELYNRGASLSKLTGTWVETDGTRFMTWVIQEDGSFSMTSPGCHSNGKFSLINPRYNEYDISMTMTNCSAFEGYYTGLSVTADTYHSNDTLSIILSSPTHALVYAPIKQ